MDGVARYAGSARGRTKARVPRVFCRPLVRGQQPVQKPPGAQRETTKGKLPKGNAQRETTNQQNPGDLLALPPSRIAARCTKGSSGTEHTMQTERNIRCRPLNLDPVCSLRLVRRTCCICSLQAPRQLYVIAENCRHPIRWKFRHVRSHIDSLNAPGRLPPLAHRPAVCARASSSWMRDPYGPGTPPRSGGPPPLPAAGIECLA